MAKQTPTAFGETVTMTSTLNGTTIPTSKTLVVTTDTLAVHAATTSAQLAGVISNETGSGALVFATSPALVTPTGIVKGDVGLASVTNPARVTFSNAAAAIATTTTYEAQVGTMSASRVLTLPAANAYPVGTPLIIADESGTVTLANTIVITCAGADTFFGTSQTTDTIMLPGGTRTLLTDGTSKWVLVSKNTLFSGDLYSPGVLAASVADIAIPSATRNCSTANQIFCRVPLPRPVVIANVTVEVTTLVSANTHGYIAWYDSAGTMQVQSADQSTTFQTTGVKTIALSYTPVWTGPSTFGWVMVYVGTATGTLACRAGQSTQSLGNLGQSTSALRSGSIALADTATMPNITPSSMASLSGLVVAAIT